MTVFITVFYFIYKKWYNIVGDTVSKFLKLFSLLFILLLVGCRKEEYITCNIEVNNNIQNYEMNGIYKIYYNGNYVEKIEKKEKYISSDISMINYFDEVNNLDYYNLNDLYGGVIYTIKNNKNDVEVDVTIDMDNVDIKKMVKNKYLDKDYVISNKLTTSGIVKIYESRGAICDI